MVVLLKNIKSYPCIHYQCQRRRLSRLGRYVDLLTPTWTYKDPESPNKNQVRGNDNVPLGPTLDPSWAKCVDLVEGACAKKKSTHTYFCGCTIVNSSGGDQKAS